MLKETGYIPHLLDDLERALGFNTTKPELIIIECQPDCSKANNRNEIIRKLSKVAYFLKSATEQVANANRVIDDNRIKFLIKRIFHTNFIEVNEILHGEKMPLIKVRWKRLQNDKALTSLNLRR